ncbi:MAG: 1-deoxy-D-xylulose-5-phosphate reductoisomerase [Muribaculaceae bacterium]|nr:1-deoxy-D-xylulose-5-phosphate reductoisomerase [Muribaculaceae bacterium]
MIKDKKNIAILGSTGSIGTQTLDIIDRFPELFRAAVITANHNWQLLAKQAIKFKPKMVVIADSSAYAPLKEALKNEEIEIACGDAEIARGASLPEVDMVVTAMVGYSGLLPTIEAIKAGKTIALANKETLVVAGEIITGLLKKYNSDIIPVDSEHSAIFQCLVGEKRSELRKILLTASGGPFRKLNKKDLEKVTVSDALNHPNWNMGAKVTIDSASMMNKGFEMIEAKWLFNCKPSEIEILIHPESIVHSMVEFHDGSIKAQLGVPDMHLPISYALSYPDRLPSDSIPLNLTKYGTLTFEKPDLERFPLLGYAFEAIEKGGNLPCILNAANEVAVASFLNNQISFIEMPELVRYTMDKTPFVKNITLQDLIETNLEGVKIANEWLKTH